MSLDRILITGGAGFVGSNLAIRLRERLHARVMAFDNLKRRGSAFNLARLQTAGVEFIHGDVRSASDFAELPPFDLLIDAAAEPSVQAGLNTSPRYVLEANLVGTINALEAARERKAAFVFLSTSRVYSIDALNQLPYRDQATRFAWCAPTGQPGFSERGITEDFSVAGPRSFYGTSKYASEQLVGEYATYAGVRAIINRCGILAGPWQMGKTDQGVVSLWVAHHLWRKPLAYIGFGGEGKQVRDVLHVDDLFELLVRQFDVVQQWNGEVYNVGGGQAGSLSLVELTQLCRDATGQQIELGSSPATSPVDVRQFITDAQRASDRFGWSPQRNPAAIVADIARWLKSHESEVRSAFGM
jgi:CDP-paratose 2-epimerase